MTVPDYVRLARHELDLDDDGHDTHGFSGDAVDVDIADAGGWFTATDVEAALQELASKDIGYQAHGNTGSTETFSALVGWHSATLNAACAFTLSGATSGLGTSMMLELAQDGTGGWAITLPASVSNKAALEAAQDTTLSTTSFLILMTRDGGTTWYGFWAGGGGSSVGALDDLSDVTITSVASGDRLRYSGSAWVNSAFRWEPLCDPSGSVVLTGHGDPVMVEMI